MVLIDRDNVNNQGHQLNCCNQLIWVNLNIVSTKNYTNKITYNHNQSIIMIEM